MAKGDLAIVEYSGMTNETDIGGRFPSLTRAQAYIKSHYNAEERDPDSPHYMHVAIAMEDANGDLTYDF